MATQSEPAAPGDPVFDPEAELAGIGSATDRLLATAARLDDDDIRAPSLLPGWTRGHVLTHIARNADGLVRLLAWGRTGIETPAYASREAREADIAAGAGRPAAEHRVDLAESAARFVAAVREMPAQRWSSPVRWGNGAERPVSAVLGARLREVEIHHVDLDVDYTPAHWHTDFSGAVLDGVTRSMTAAGDVPSLQLYAVDTDRTWVLGTPAADGPRVSGPEAALLAWLIGRSSGDGLLREPHDLPLPVPPPWS